MSDPGAVFYKHQGSIQLRYYRQLGWSNHVGCHKGPGELVFETTRRES